MGALPVTPWSAACGRAVSIADLQRDMLKRRVTRQGDRIALTNMEFALPRLLSRTHTASQGWQINFDSDTNVVDVAIRRLHGMIDDPYPGTLVRSVRGVGLYAPGAALTLWPGTPSLRLALLFAVSSRAPLLGGIASTRMAR